MEITNKNYKEEDINLLLEDLKRLETHTEELWHFLPIPACLANPAFNIVNASKALEERSGYKDLEITGENLNELLKNFEEIKKELAIKETLSSQEETFLTKEKKEIPISLSAKTRKDEKGDITGYFFAFIDLTEIKEKEKELQKKIKELQKFTKLAVGREIKMVELKKEIQALKKEVEGKK